jgi:predicted TIM-barrel fold metal-dependent hydrolase
MNIMADSLKRGTAAETFRKLYWDTALAWSDPVLNTLRQVAGVNRVLFGTDFPYLRRDIAVRSKINISDSIQLSGEEKKQVLGVNALELFPRFNSIYHEN